MQAIHHFTLVRYILKTKVLLSGPGLDVLQKSGKDPCGVGLKGIGTNSIFCGGCSSWIHKKCSGIPGHLKSDTSFRCKRCIVQARPIDGRLMTVVTVCREKLEGCHLPFTLGTAYPQVAIVNLLLSQAAVSHGAKSISSCPSSLPAHFPSPSEEVFNSCVRSTMLHVSETWAPTLSDLHLLQHSDPSYDSLDVQSHQQESSHLAGSLWEDAAWQSGKGTPHPPTQMARPYRM